MKRLWINVTVKLGKTLIIYPVLLAVFPVLFLYTQNIDQTTARQALSPLWFSVPGALLLWFLLYLWMRNIFKAGLATTLFVILFFFYGHFYTLLEKRDILVPSQGILLPLLVLVCGYLVYFIKITRRDFRNTTKVLNAVAAVLILINLFNIVSYQIGKPALSPNQTLSQPNFAATNTIPKGTVASTVPEEASARPDIYFIILDEYANPDTMKDLYGYDDSELLSNLKNQGFYVAPNSQMHNDETIRAIASILNMEYTPETEATDVTYQRITNNAVVNYLRPLGYQYVYFGQWYEEGRYQIPADIYYNFYEAAEKGTLTTEYSTTFWNTTAISPFYNYFLGQQYEGYYRDALLNTLNQLQKVPEIAGPKFVYAHLICPHAPFVFGPNGERIDSTNYYNVDDKQYYLGQYIFISQEIDKVIGQILSKSTTDPIIIVQSDHGPRWTSQWEKILNAYHLPGDGEKLLYNNISPINSFRLIFDHYFNANYEMLEDK